MTGHHAVQRAVFAVSLVLVAPIAVARAQRIATAELLTRGVQAYDRLPDHVTLRDARTFSEATGYLFAYQQRASQENVSVGTGPRDALRWLLSNLRNMEVGKGDLAADWDAMRQRGMAMYK